VIAIPTGMTGLGTLLPSWYAATKEHVEEFVGLYGQPGEVPGRQVVDWLNGTLAVDLQGIDRFIDRVIEESEHHGPGGC